MTQHAPPDSRPVSPESPTSPVVAAGKPSLWQRWMNWNGSFLVMSILLHVLLIAGATFLIVQVVQGRKEKLKFTAPPPAPPAAEHKVKPSKKASAAPAVSKRITTTAVNVSVSLPQVDLSAPSTQAPDLMASVMAGMGQGALGSGAVGGVSAMPLTGLTAFGFRGGKGPGLRGTFYDFKQTPAHSPTDAAKQGATGTGAHAAILSDFFKRGWDDSVFKKYFQAKDTVIAPQFIMPQMKSEEACKAFGVEKEIQGLRWAVLYKGRVVPPRSGTFRFVGLGDDLLAVSFNGDPVLFSAYPINQAPIAGLISCFPSLQKEQEALPRPFGDIGGVKGKWFQVEGGKTYDMQVLCSEAYGGWSSYYLMIEEKGVKPVAVVSTSNAPNRRAPAQLPDFTAFQVIKGTKMPDNIHPQLPIPLVQPIVFPSP
jgi:hypothetical protein